MLDLLNEQEANVCGICFKEDDNTNNSDVLWVVCENCGLWVHKSCDLENSDVLDYKCPLCAKKIAD